MLDKQKVEEFWKKRTEIKDPRIATHYKHDDTLKFDLDLIFKYVTQNSQVLDFGCGTGAIINTLEPHVSKITAIDKSAEFLNFCIDSPKITKKTADLPYYEDNNTYDLIIMFGLLGFLNNDEVSQLYKLSYKLLKENGKLLIKHACGINEDVMIDGYSEALQQWYHTIYRSVTHDQQLIADVFPRHTLVDIYPDHLNPWPNTHYYVFIVEK